MEGTGISAPVTFPDALNLATVEHQRFADLLCALGPDDWPLPTDCELWTVRDLCGHVLGSMHTYASLPRAMAFYWRAQRRAKQNNTDVLAESTAAQVRAFAAIEDADVAEQFVALSARNLCGRRRIPSFFRRAPITVEGHRYALGYIAGIVLTRDVWMHRVDLTRATGRELILTPDHDGRIVADVVGDWARAHDQPFALELEGPAGGRWSHDSTDEVLMHDAIEFCRILSGRGTSTGLLTQPVLF